MGSESSNQKKKNENDAFSSPPYVTKASIIFACRNNTFGPWPNLFQTIKENLMDETRPIDIFDIFCGHTDLDSVHKKLKNYGDYCMRYHDEGGFQLCYKAIVKDGKDLFKEERI